MVATLKTARDEILDAFTVKWLADTPAVAGGTAPQIFYRGVGELAEQPHDAAWCRITVAHNNAFQPGLHGADGRRRFRKEGLVTVQIFAPLEGGGGLTLADDLATIAVQAFEGVDTASDVWFRNVRPLEVGADGPWFNLNVVAEFEYDDFGG